MGTVLNQTGRAVEIVSITMAVYPAISLVNVGPDGRLQPARAAG